MRSDLDRLAEAHGIVLEYESEGGDIKQASELAKRELLAALGIPSKTDDDVRASLGTDGGKRESNSAEAYGNAKCFVPERLKHGKCWGITCQLYGLRSARNWGIGDFADLALLGSIAAERGADLIGLSPLHALFLADPERCSPYSPSSRRFLNPLYIAIDWLPWAKPTTESRDHLQTGYLIDYGLVADAKRGALKAAYSTFLAAADSGERAHFEGFRAKRGEALRDFATFEAMSEEFSRTGASGAGWTTWPAPYRDKTSNEVKAFVRDHEDRIGFHAWLQWQAHEQLIAVQHKLVANGMAVGLYLDIAVGVAPDGAETWSSPGIALADVHIGAPPDRFNVEGQDWGLAPLSPDALRSDGMGVFRDVIRQNMEPAGAIRIDHVMALERLYLIPKGLPTADGAYVSYPFAQMVETVCDVSQELKTMVVGEDLGTVRKEFRQAMSDAEILSYRLLPFEREPGGAFKRPERWPVKALACALTHDLPTLQGWWNGSDLEQLLEFRIVSEDWAKVERAERANDRRRLLSALADAGLVAREEAGVAEWAKLPDDLVVAIHRYLARTPCRMLAVQIEDMIGATERTNVPGTVTEHPNWRRRLPVAVTDLPDHKLFNRLADAMSEERPRPG